MYGTPYDKLLVFILAVDRAVFVYVVSVNVLFALGITLVMGKGRTRLEQIAIGVIIFVALMVGSVLIFRYLAGRPVMRLEAVSFP
jgi:hypothetical protein